MRIEKARCSRVALAMAFLALALAMGPAIAQPAAKRSVLVIFFDGFRWDLVNETLTPNLNRLSRSGVRGEMIPVWPTVSCPNHWALATGLYPIHSGIHHNEMYDPATGKLLDVLQPGWGKGEPIWATAIRQGKSAGVIGAADPIWMGSQVKEGPHRPSFVIRYSPLPGERDNRPSLVLDLLDQADESRPDFLAWYVPEVDISEHEYGVGSKEANETLRTLDRLVGQLLSGLEKRALSGKVNIVVVADHGQMLSGPNQLIDVTQVIDENQLRFPPLNGGPQLQLWPKPGLEHGLYEKLSKVHPHLRAVRLADISPATHCCDPERFPPLMLVADPGWTVAYKPTPESTLAGMHGYDSQMREMHPIFLAAGPDIRAGGALKPFQIVDVYPLMAHLLGVVPAANDGSLQSMCGILEHPPANCARAP